MSNQRILATFLDGVFRPVALGSLNLFEGQTVMLTVEPIDRAAYILSLAKQVYEGLSEEEIDEIERAMRRRPNFFGDDETEGTQLDPSRPT